MMMTIEERLSDLDYSSYRVPAGKAADSFMQKRLQEDLHVNAYVYAPSQVRTEEGVEFEAQIERDDDVIRVLVFNVSDLTEERIKKVEQDILHVRDALEQ